MAKPRLQLQGKVFGYLTVVADAGNTAEGKSRWLVRCICGREKILPAAIFYRKGNHPVSKSCGCLRRRLISEATSTHGMSKHPAYAIWRSMIDRCRLPTHQAWKNYGARGIKVCDRWASSFEGFWEDMGSSYRSGLTLERVDNSKGYQPGNCIWATYSQQGSNRRTNRRIHTPWGYLTVSEAARKSGIGHTTLLYRINTQVPKEHLFDAPDTTRSFFR